MKWTFLLQRQSCAVKKKKQPKKRRKAATVEKRGPLVKKNSENGRERETDLSFSAVSVVWQVLCTAAVFVNQGQGCLLDNFSGRKEGRRGKRGRKKKRMKRERDEGRELRHWAVTAGNGLIRLGVDCVPCVDSMSPQSLGLGEEPGN